MDLQYRFTLTVKDASPQISQVISEPDGWQKMKMILERDKEWMSLVELMEVPLFFYGSNGEFDGGKDFLEENIATFGINVQIELLIEVSETQGIVWEDLFVGMIDVQSKKNIDSRRIQFVITRNDFWAKFKNQIEKPVDLKAAVDIYGDAVTPVREIELQLTSQKIQKSYRAIQSFGVRIGGDHDAVGEFPCSNWPNDDYSNSDFIQLDPDRVEIDEIEETFSLSTEINPELPVYKIYAEYGGDYTFDLYVAMSYRSSLVGPPIEDVFENTSTKVSWFIQINNGEPIAFTATNYSNGSGQEWTEYTYNDTLSLNPTDTIRIYGDILTNPADTLDDLIIWGEDGLSNCDGSHLFDKLGSDTTHFYITAQTEYINTEAGAFLAHDVGYGVMERIAMPDSFYSEALGSMSTQTRAYENDGCYWLNALVRGLQLRQYTLTEKPFSISFKQWWEGLNPILNLGLGYDVIEGNEVVRVEEKAFFFDPDPILYLDFVNNIEESYDKDYIYKSVKVGYKKWQSEDVSGIDDPQTNHEYSTLFKIVGVPTTIQSDFIAASYAIETTRRTTKEKSADYKYDNETFIISLNSVSSPEGTYQPELNENFDNITNLLNEETRYNIRYTPARNLLRWANILFGCVQEYLSSFLTFQSGEGNFDMTSEMVPLSPGNCRDDFDGNSLSEKQDIPVTNDYLFKPILKEFKFPLSYSNYKLIRDNRTRAIAISGTDENHEICFIKRLEYDINKSLATFIVWTR